MESKRILLLGGGGHCRSVLDSLLRQGSYDRIGIIDRDHSDTDTFGIHVVGTDDDLPKLKEEGWHDAFLTMGSIASTNRRRELFERASRVGFHFPRIIDTSAVISEFAELGTGVFVGKNAVINAGAIIGDMAIINTASVVEHDCRVGSFAHISVGAVVCGGCNIADDAFIGANAVVIQGRNVGEKSVVGAGCLVLRDVPNNRTFVG